MRTPEGAAVAGGAPLGAGTVVAEPAGGEQSAAALAAAIESQMARMYQPFKG